VGLPSSGKSMLFEALTGVRASGEVGMAAIPHAQQTPNRAGAEDHAGSDSVASEVAGLQPFDLAARPHARRAASKEHGLAGARSPTIPTSSALRGVWRDLLLQRRPAHDAATTDRAFALPEDRRNVGIREVEDKLQRQHCCCSGDRLSISCIIDWRPIDCIASESADGSSEP